MKISNEDKYKYNQNTDYIELLNNFEEEYGTVYMCKIEDIVFIYRTLGRKEYKDLIQSDINDMEKEDVVCEACTLYPENFDFNNAIAGIPSELCRLIMKNSFLDSLESKKNIVTYFRNQMTVFDNQVDCIISEAFPNISIEEIASWDMIKTARYLAQAEWKLNILRQIPMDIDIFNQMLEIDWYQDHPKEYEEAVKNTQNNQSGEAPSELKFVPGETLEERQARLAQKGQPRRRTPEEIAELRRKYPEIDWGSEVDPNEDIDAMRDVVDTTSPALRPGF